MDTQLIREYIRQMAAGTLSPEKEEWLLRYLGNATGEELAAIYPPEEWEATLPQQVSRLELDRVYQQVTGRESSRRPHIVAAPQWWKRGWVKAACVTALFISAGAAFFSLNNARPGKQVAQKWITLSTSDGEKKLVSLSDSTKLYLNGASVVMIPEFFEQDKRQIKLLKGETFIEVGHDPERPFTAEVGDVRVEVLGTSFNMRNYHDEPLISVKVKTGKVAMVSALADQRLVLTAGNQGIYARGTRLLRQSGYSTATIGGWTKQEFYFDNISLGEIFSELRHCYGLQFNVSDQELLERPVKATFRQQEPDEIIRILSKMGRFSYTKKGSAINIYSHRKKDQPAIRR